MADIRNISLTKKAQSADISNASVTTTVNFPSIVATIPDVANFGIAIETDTRINVNLDGYGEEAIPQPNLIKYAQDLVSSIDVARKTVNKRFIESFTRSEVFSKLIKTVKLDNITTTDLFSKVVYFRRTFTDIVDATDDFYGVTNIDDDQTAFVEKRISETFTRIEEIRKSLAKGLNESFTRIEVVSKTIFPSKIETTTTSEQFTFSTFLVKTDIADVSDQLAKAFTRGLTTDSILSTDISAKALSTIYADSFNTADLITHISVGKLNLDVINYDELLSFDAAKGLTDIADVSDPISKAFLRPVTADTTTIADTLFRKHIRVYIEEFGPYFSQLYVDLQYTADDYTNNPVYTTDSITEFSFSKVIIDILDATDDFYGIANIDDDQTAYLSKRLIDWLAIQESFVRTVLYIRSFTDSFTRSEERKILINKVILETSNTAASDIFSRVFIAIRSFTDISSVSEIFSKSFSKITTELLSTSEVIAKTVRPSKVETISTTEALSKVTSKVLTDLVDATDDFYGLANVDDDQTARIDKIVIDYGTLTESFSRIAAFIRSFTDIATISENFRKSISKILSDQINRSEIVTKLYAKVSTETVSSSQTLTINIQSYFQSDYVAVGYTGQNYTY